MDDTMTIEEVLAELHSEESGLSREEVERRRTQHGFNEFPQKRRSLLLLFLDQFRDVMVVILIAALALSLIMPFLENGGSPPLEAFLDAAVIAAILILNALLGFVQEYRAGEAIKALQKLTAPVSRVRRSGKDVSIPSRELVPGDIVLLETGDKIAADGRLIAVSHCEVNEASLTGESRTVEKNVAPLSAGSHPLAERPHSVFAGTVVTRGSATFIVTAIGKMSEIGKIASLVEETPVPETPLEGRMRSLGKLLGVVALTMSGAVFLMGIVQNIAPLHMLLVGVSLAVSAVPEGLPAVVTVCLAMGVRRMVKQNALVRKLDALEALGSVTVICADKTGTITENRMEVVDVWVRSQAEKELLVQIGASCNRAKLPDFGDPTEIGLLRFAEKLGVERLPLENEEVPFTSEEKYMQTRHRSTELTAGRSTELTAGRSTELTAGRSTELTAGGSCVFLKGAPEKILALSHGEDAERILAANHAFAKRGLRVLACAVKGEHLARPRIIGLIAMEDPPREGMKDALAEGSRAGIRTIMITGDNPVTALAIAKQVGIEGDALLGSDLDRMAVQDVQRALEHVSVFARVSPGHKLKILKALQAEGEVVAMSGDGVNDAPALKGAHVGIAMGNVGTDVAREAASIVLTDDHYATIVSAIREGRRIYDNIRKFVIYLLRSNFDELLFIATVIILGLPLPYLPIHILWINLMTDGLPALALGMEPAEPDIMRRPPRHPEEHILAGEGGRLVIASVLSFALAFAYYLWLLSSGTPLIEARSATLTLAILFELFMAFGMRSRQPFFRVGIRRNPWLLGAVCVPILLQLLILYSPLSAAFRLSPLSFPEWGEVFLIALAGFLFFEFLKLRYGENRSLSYEGSTV